MGHLTSNHPWGMVDLDTASGRVFVQQDWHYIWCVYAGADPWTYREKYLFHRQADRAIWGIWSNRLVLHVNGTAPFPDRKIPVNFDIRWKISGSSHFTVLAWKVPPGSGPTDPVWSSVTWHDKRIQLSSADVLPRSAANAAGESTQSFLTIPHEFGHALDDLPDEYNESTPESPNPYLHDRDSIMNVGREIRSRHIEPLCDALKAMVPTATFVYDK